HRREHLHIRLQQRRAGHHNQAGRPGRWRSITQRKTRSTIERFLQRMHEHPRTTSSTRTTEDHVEAVEATSRTSATASQASTGAVRPAHRPTHSRLPHEQYGILHRVLPLGARSVAFRYDGSVTVPGKGGRPRKWASDADRIRAFRARERGDEEPATVPELLAAGEENAAAWAQAHELAETVSRQRATIRALERELKATRQEMKKQQAQFGWLDGENERLRGLVGERSGEVTDRADPRPAQPRVTAPLTTVDDPAQTPTTTPQPNRAQRRQADKRSRRRW
ncbi:MAG: hypothetical protein JWN62_3674, partial [Acidimicrobiales bacterium]|nr:hypothetical protein [Acidimicrobiales bacterium]